MSDALQTLHDKVKNLSLNGHEAHRSEQNRIKTPRPGMNLPESTPETCSRLAELGRLYNGKPILGHLQTTADSTVFSGCTDETMTMALLQVELASGETTLSYYVT